MDQYSDVSQYINESGQRFLLNNPAVGDGLFTGQSVGNASNGDTAYFFPLFPGYETAMHLGRIGSRFPINAATYHCLYFAMKVNSKAANVFGPDQYRLFWFGDDRLVNGPWGGSEGLALYPEAGAGAPVLGYRLYRVDLATIQRLVGNTDWDSRSTWQGIRIDPTINSNISFAVDWVRLTTCAANNHNFTWNPDLRVQALWLKRAGTNRFVRVATGLVGLGGGAGGTGSVDLQGVPPGSYTVGVGSNTGCCYEESTALLVINQTPIVEFARPSFFSGEDYATQQGYPWNFSSPGDVVKAFNMSYSIGGGVLDATTQSGPVPAGTDAQFFVRTPQPIAASHYRYLSFRMLTTWKNNWQITPDGMIVRVIWAIQGPGTPTNRCYFVSQDVPVDVGWHTYWVDFGDSFKGSPEDKAGDCPGGLPHWTASPPILELRFDPNENITVGADPPGGGGPFYQQIDWMRLTAIDRVDRGTPFPVQVAVNRDVSELTYYYTTDPNNPTQKTAQQYTSQPPTGRFRRFLPFLTRPSVSSLAGVPAANQSFLWNTANVSPNLYYICVKADGGPNSGTYCSEAPVIVE
jgi:hypothetical protein